MAANKSIIDYGQFSRKKREALLPFLFLLRMMNEVDNNLTPLRRLIMLSGLNSDWVLFGSLGTVAVTVVVLLLWGWKTFLSMEKNLDNE